MDKEIDLNDRKQSESTGKLRDIASTTSEVDRHITQRLYDVREAIDNHVGQIHTSVVENVKQTIKYLQNMQRSNKNISKRWSSSRKAVLLDPSMYKIRQLWDQAASLETESAERDFGVPIIYQPTESKTQITKLEPIKRNVQKMVKKEQMEPKEEQKSRLKLTKGEKDELMAILAKSHLLEEIPQLTRSDKKSVQTHSMTTSPSPLPPPVVKLILVDRKIERFKRQSPDNKMVNGPFFTFLSKFLMSILFRLFI